MPSPPFMGLWKNVTLCLFEGVRMGQGFACTQGPAALVLLSRRRASSSSLWKKPTGYDEQSQFSPEGETHLPVRKTAELVAAPAPRPIPGGNKGPGPLDSGVSGAAVAREQLTDHSEAPLGTSWPAVKCTKESSPFSTIMKNQMCPSAKGR